MKVVPPPLPVSSLASPSRGRRISCAVAIFLVFVFVGPPVGALAFMLPDLGNYAVGAPEPTRGETNLNGGFGCYGVYRTKDGGATWQKVLYVDANTGASDVAMDAHNPRILFAGTWQTRREPWRMTSGGAGSALYRSADGGDTWKKVEADGLPKGPWGKVGVAVAPSDPSRVYALIEAEAGGLYRSDDGGETWSLANAHRILRQRAWYYSTITVDSMTRRPRSTSSGARPSLYDCHLPTEVE